MLKIFYSYLPLVASIKQPYKKHDLEWLLGFLLCNECRKNRIDEDLIVLKSWNIWWYRYSPVLPILSECRLQEMSWMKEICSIVWQKIHLRKQVLELCILANLLLLNVNHLDARLIWSVTYYLYYEFI